MWLRASALRTSSVRRPSSAPASASSTTPPSCRSCRTCGSSGPLRSSRSSVQTAERWIYRSPIAGPSFSSTAAIGGWPQNPENRSPYSMQWNLFIQRELMNDLSLDIGYVGSGSRKQIGYSPFNNAADTRSGRHRPAPSAATVWGSRRRLEPVQRLLQQSSGIVGQTFLEADC